MCEVGLTIYSKRRIKKLNCEKAKDNQAQAIYLHRKWKAY